MGGCLQPLVAGASAAKLTEAVACESAASRAAPESDAYAPGTQKLRVEGEVLRWHLGDDAADRIPASVYIEMLEREVALLRRQVSLYSGMRCRSTPVSWP